MTDAPKRRYVVATITASDTRTDEDDEGGWLLRELIGSHGFDLGTHSIEREDLDSLRRAGINVLAKDDVDALVVTGGTGLGPRDVTIEAFTPLFEKEVPGFGEAFRRLSWDQIGPRAVLSRASMGSRHGKIIALLPGSPGGVELGVNQLLAPVLAHAIKVARGHAKHAPPSKRD